MSQDRPGDLNQSMFLILSHSSEIRELTNVLNLS
jgi:hypothetical protein